MMKLRIIYSRLIPVKTDGATTLIYHNKANDLSIAKYLLPNISIRQLINLKIFCLSINIIVLL